MTLSPLPPIPSSLSQEPSAVEWYNALKRWTASAGSEIAALQAANEVAIVEAEAEPEVSSLRFIESQTFTGAEATADFTAFDSTKYDAYKFVLQNVVPVNDSVDLYLRTSADGGSIYDATSGHYQYGRGNNYPSGASDSGSTTSTGVILITSVGSAANEDGVSGGLTLYAPHLAKKTMMTWEVASIDFTGVLYGGNGSGLRTSSAKVNAIRFLFASGNIESGTITMYGMANSLDV